MAEEINMDVQQLAVMLQQALQQGNADVSNQVFANNVTPIMQTASWRSMSIQQLEGIVHQLSSNPEVIDVALNELDQRIYIKNQRTGKYTDSMTDYDALRVIGSIESATGGQQVPRNMHDMLIKLLAGANKYNPIEAMVAEIPDWDGEDRAQYFLNNIGHLIHRNKDDKDDFKAKEAYYHVVSVLLLLSVSVRAKDTKHYVKQDSMFVLSGRNGTRKSTFVRELVWDKNLTNDTETLDIKNADNAMTLSMTLVNEIAEMSSIDGRSVNRVKAALSSADLTFRPPYGKYQVTMPFHNTLFATTNDPQILNDATGNRKFIMIDVEDEADTEKMTPGYMKSLYAEVLYKYHNEWGTPALTLQSISEALGYEPDKVEAFAEEMRHGHSMYNSMEGVVQNIIRKTEDDVLPGLKNLIAAQDAVRLDGNEHVRGINTKRLRTALDIAVVKATNDKKDAGVKAHNVEARDIEEVIAKNRVYKIEVAKALGALGFVDARGNFAELGIKNERNWYVRK